MHDELNSGRREARVNETVLKEVLVDIIEGLLQVKFKSNTPLLLLLDFRVL